MAPLFVNDANNSSSSNAQQYQNPSTSMVQSPLNGNAGGDVVGVSGESNGYHDDDGLGPLPPNWEIALTETGEKYFIE